MEKELEKIYDTAVRKINEKENKMEFLVFSYNKLGIPKEKDKPLVIFDEKSKYAEFSEKYMEKARSMKEFKNLMGYLDKNNYIGG